MDLEGVHSAISTTFKRDFDSLKFTNAPKFSGIDKNVPIVLTLQSAFKGKGEYPFDGQAKLYDEYSFSKRYNLSGKVQVDDIDGEPTIKFISTISVRML